MIRATITLMAAASMLAACSATSATPTGSVHQEAGGVVLAFAEPTHSHVCTHPGPSSIAFVINRSEDRLKRLTGSERITAALTRTTCTTEQGRVVSIDIENRANDAKISISPQGWKADEIRLAIKASEHEDFYGCGEVWNGSVNQRGKSVTMWVGEGTPDKCCYVPFYFSTRGYGLYVDSYERGTFDFCAADSGSVGVAFATKESPSLTLHLIAGPSPKQIISNYTTITGKPPLPPKWSFLPWKWRDKYNNWEEVFEDARGMRDNNIPCSVIWIDNPWQKYGLCSFEFDPVRFPDAPRRIKELKAMGYKVIVWVAPMTTPEVPNFQVARDKGYLVKNPAGEPYNLREGYYIDLTNPDAFAWWKQEMKKVIKLGIDGFKLDRGQKIPLDAVFSDGSTGASMHNRYALLYCQVCNEALREELGNDFTMLPRPGCAGSQVYSPGKWPGDLAANFSAEAGLGSAITAGQCIALSGFPFWGSDIGGFERGGPDTRLLARWAQFGCFSPIMELGGQDPHEPWLPIFGKQGLAIYRYYATLHAELLPYTYTLAVEAHRTGVPIIRPLVLEFPTDPAAGTQPYEFTYGPDILVAPIHTAEDKRDIDLPSGEWVDYWNWNKVLKGSSSLEGAEFPLERAPIYLRNGAIIPMDVTSAGTGHGGSYSRGKLTILALPSGKSAFSLREKVSSTEFTMSAGAGQVTINWEDQPKPLILRVRTKSPTGVTSTTGVKLQRLKSASEFKGKPGTWAYDKSGFCTLISPKASDRGVVIRPK